MKIKQFQVDAFASRAFEGNPAAVCPLEYWLEDELLQSIAEENNLSETAFFVPSAKGFSLRWFTPTKEVELCGHATLATAHVIFESLGFSESSIAFETLSGDLFVKKHGDCLQMDFPASPLTSCDISEALVNALGVRPEEVWADNDYVAVFENEATIRNIIPDQALLGSLDLRGVIVTAPGGEVDFVSRFFAPKVGIPEDPVTGAAHCKLAPYWAGRLSKNRLTARQISKRGGNVECEVKNDRVLLSGSAVTFMEAEINF
ncbi:MULTISPECIES: PhzF family phenazine biosynthesis protein [unclassified Methylophaga]|uniref:PhzF family phenazine biosynthesis protein n=1 Tax=unclassified Methylophaga TaxID=2629249 RepID=UPI000C990966|nr:MULTISPECIES: PhzF family phenazine biosynthesis protein [unclassified Methylophaga]MBN47038.1 isomerase [Methylophaga sp.]|tara:strand:+ start:78125 stop:78904 length:780 start_codon:yes stop_codon:yes gene_type:complete